MITRTLCHGDNLDFLKAMPSESVDLVATDPPFNTGRDFKSANGQFSDKWAWGDEHSQWLKEIHLASATAGQVVGVTRNVQGESTAAYLCWLGVRLVEIRRVLTNNGSLYLHLDDAMSPYVRVFLDAVFGGDSFRNQIGWKRSTAHSDGKQGRQQYGRIQDAVLFYTKSDVRTWNPQYTDYDPKYVDGFYKHLDPESGRYYRLDNLTGPGGASKGNPQYEVMGVTRYWRYSKERMQQLIDEGRIVQTKPGGVPRYKRYLDEMSGVPLQDWWSDISPIASQSKERTGYPTQKPIALYDRIIKASSNEGDLILDPFAGSGTTLVAAERLGRQWVGMDLWADDSLRVVLNRLTSGSVSIGDVEYKSSP